MSFYIVQYCTARVYKYYSCIDQLQSASHPSIIMQNEIHDVQLCQTTWNKISSSQ